MSREVFDVILPHGHPLTKIAKRSSVTLTDLAPFPLVSLPYESRTRRIIDSAAATAGQTLLHVATVTQAADHLFVFQHRHHDERADVAQFDAIYGNRFSAEVGLVCA